MAGCGAFYCLHFSLTGVKVALARPLVLAGGHKIIDSSAPMRRDFILMASFYLNATEPGDAATRCARFTAAADNIDLRLTFEELSVALKWAL